MLKVFQCRKLLELCKGELTAFLPPVDHGCVGVQRSGHLLWHEDAGLAVHEALPVAGAVEHSYIQV